MRQRWPAKLWIVRHGQSAGNVARDAADAAGLPVIDLKVRDVDVPLSELGHRQAAALGRFGLRPAEALFVDDRLINVEGARAVGMHGHLFTGAADLRTRLEADGLL